MVIFFSKSSALTASQIESVTLLESDNNDGSPTSTSSSSSSSVYETVDLTPRSTILRHHQKNQKLRKQQGENVRRKPNVCIVGSSFFFSHASFSPFLCSFWQWSEQICLIFIFGKFRGRIPSFHVRGLLRREQPQPQRLQDLQPWQEAPNCENQRRKRKRWRRRWRRTLWGVRGLCRLPDRQPALQQQRGTPEELGRNQRQDLHQRNRPRSHLR